MNRIGQVEDGLSASVIVLQRHNLAMRPDLREAHDVRVVRATEGEDRLGVIADNKDIAVILRQQIGNVSLEVVGVLVFVNHDVRVTVRDSPPVNFLL